MKACWEKKRLSELCTVFADGDWIESKDQAPEGIRLIQTGNVGEGVFKDRGDKARYISEATFDKLRCTEIFEGDCLVSRLPDPVGRSCILPNVMERMITAVDCTIIRFDVTRICPEFFNYYSQSSEYLNAVDAETTGTTRKRISRSKLAQTLIPLPPLPEQQRIVAILDETFEAITVARANAEQNRQNARALFESYLQSVFSQRGEGWVEKSLDDIGTTQTGSTPKSSEQSSYGDFMPFVKPGDFNSDGSLNYENDGLSEAGAANSRKVKAGSALMVCIGATIGKAGFCDRIIATNQQINAFTPNEFVSYKFIYYQMLTGSFKQRVIHASGQATLPIINKSKWSALTVAVPPTLDEQHKVVERLDALRNETQRLESLYLRKIAALDELKQSLLQQAFSGQLDTTRLEKLPV
ncbi:restriction endonuclease subunit S [Aeromonas caviae]|uniref:restriction endonuclease subunit S n=1 Tax=Aeromonas caviae TaxID=648 RepID=UPI0038D244FE